MENPKRRETKRAHHRSSRDPRTTRARRRRQKQRQRRARKRMITLVLALLLLLIIILLILRLKGNKNSDISDTETRQGQKIAQEEAKKKAFNQYSSLPYIGQKIYVVPEGIAKGTSVYPYEEIPDFMVAEAYLDLPEELQKQYKKYPEARSSLLKYDQWKRHPAVMNLDHVRYIGKFPNSIQWDPMWAFSRYGDGLLAVNGCGPTTFSNIIVGFTGKKDFTPYAAARFCEKNDYSGAGTFVSLFDFGPEKFGLQSRRIVFDEKILLDELAKGNIICILSSEGSFAQGKHYVFVQGKDADGYIVNDPNSPANSDKRWSFQSIHTAAELAWSIGK